MVPIADRTTKVSLVAQVSGYVAGMEQAARKTREVGSEAEKLAQKKQAFQEMGRASLAMGVVAAAGVALAIAKYAEFDQAMSNVRAATQETASNMGLLREAALDAGAKTVFTATEAANAIEELGKNGLSTADILNGGLNAALSLASAGQLGVARAAEVTALSMKQFNLAGKDSGHIADLLAAGAGKAAGDVEDMAQALAQGGLVAHQTGLSVEETTGTLAAFADNALIGSDAGTSLKTMLQRLTPQSAQARDKMAELGISAYDAQGNFIGMSKFAGVLHDALEPLSAEARNSAMSVIFGSDAVRAASVIYEEGADGIQKYIDQTNDSGYAAKVAADRLDNLAGDVEKLGGSFDTALIKTGSGANDILRGIVQSAGFLVDVFGNLPQPVLNASLAVGAVGAALLLTGGAALVAVPKIAAFKDGLQTLNISAKGTATSVGLIGGAVSAATLIIGAFLAAEAQKASNVDAFAQSLDKATGKVTSYTREIVKNRLQSEGVYDAAKKAGIGLDLVTKAATGNKDAVKELKKQTSEWFATQSLTDRAIGGAGLAYDKLSDSVRFVREDIDKAKKSNENLAEATDATTASTEAAAAATEAAAKAQDEWIAAVAEADASFVDLDGAYDAAMQKAQDLATATGESTGAVGDALSGMVADAKVSTGDYIAELQKQVDAQNNWESNMVLLAAKVPAGMLKELADLGPKGAAEVALMTTMTDAELQKTVELWQERGGDAPNAFATELAAAGPTIAAVAAKYGQGAVDALSAKIKAGEGLDVAMAELNLTIEGNPPTVTPKANTAPALESFDNMQAYGEAMQIWLHAQGDTVPARSQFTSERNYQEGLQLWLTANGITRPARAEFESAGQYAEALQIYMTALGNTRPARGDFASAKAYGDALQSWITAMANTDPAEQALEAVANKKRYATIQAVIQGGTDAGAAKAAYSRATGGILPGPPSSKDNMFIHAASGEFVVNAAATQRNRALLESINSGQVRGYASGGYVSPVRYAPAPSAVPAFNVVVQSKGGVDLLKYVDVRVEAADRDRDTASSMGWSVSR